MEKDSNKNMKMTKFLMNNFIIFFLLILIIGCEKNKSINEAIAPCEDAYINDLAPIKQIATSDFFNANLWSGSRTSEKYLVTSGDIADNYKYMVVNHQAQTLKFFERPYAIGFPLSDCRLYQIDQDHLYLARLDRALGWMIEDIHFETMNSQVISINLGNEIPKEILQVEKHENAIFFTAQPPVPMSNPDFIFHVAEIKEAFSKKTHDTTVCSQAILSKLKVSIVEQMPEMPDDSYLEEF